MDEEGHFTSTMESTGGNCTVTVAATKDSVLQQQHTSVNLGFNDVIQGNIVTSHSRGRNGLFNTKPSISANISKKVCSFNKDAKKDHLIATYKVKKSGKRKVISDKKFNDKFEGNSTVRPNANSDEHSNNIDVFTTENNIVNLHSDNNEIEPHYPMKANGKGKYLNYPCVLCKKQCYTREKLKIHEETKCDSVKPFGCNICAKGFPTKHCLRIHIQKIHNNQKHRKCKKCEICNKMFGACDLERHIVRTHQRVPKTCQYCQKSYPSEEHLKEHISYAHRTKDSKHFKCADCGLSWGTKDMLTLHMRRFHLPDIIKCTLCVQVFSTQETFQRHFKSKHSEDSKLVCDACGKRFNFKYILINHLRIHTGEKPFMCQTCGKCFRTNNNLQQHSVVHSENRPYSCDNCGKSFRVRNHLRQHMAVHGLTHTVSRKVCNNKNKIKKNN